MRAIFVEANTLLASSDVMVAPGSIQPKMMDIQGDEVIIERLTNVDLKIQKPNGEVLPVCFVPSGKDALELTSDIREEVAAVKTSGRGDAVNDLKGLLPMTYVVKISRSEAAPLFGSRTDEVFAAPMKHLDVIFKYYVIQSEIKQGERYGWYTRLVSGVMKPDEAAAKGVLRVDSDGQFLTVTLSYYVLDTTGEAFVRGNYLIVPDGLNDRLIKDPVWLNKWAKACSSVESPSASSGGGCRAGLGLSALAAAAAIAARAKKSKKRDKA